MLGKFSVRKPFTVFVMVVLIIILGVISFMNTTTDLLPSINLPYAVVVTTYVGATPEEVESRITSPIEGSMAAVSGIQNISSISREHYSVVILEFVSSANMDSVSLEVREYLDRMTLPEGAGKPGVLKLNPNMIPIMVNAVDIDGKNLDEVSALAESEIVPAVKSVAGVASVSVSGLIRNELHVVLYADKVEEVNKHIRATLQKQVDDAIAEARAQMEALIAQTVAEQVEAYSVSRMAELMAGGLPQNLAEQQLALELPAVTGQITVAVTEEITAAAQENAEGADTAPDFSEVGIPEEMLSLDMIKNILTAQNFSMPAGSFEENDVEYMVRVGDKYGTVDEVRNTLLFDMGIEGVEPVRLSDIADVFTTDNSLRTYTYVNGNPAVMMTIQKQTEFSTSDVTKAVSARLEELESQITGLHATALMDQGDYIEIIVDSVIQNLLMGAVLAIIILVIFLRDFRPTLVVAISIPISLMTAFAAMYFSGVTLNIISMSGLALGVGMLVDNSIVVIENIYRLRSLGVPPRRAAVEGTRQVAGAIASSTLTTISVFLPVVFTDGITRQLFTDLGLTIAYSLLASLLIALTVVPAASGTVFHNVRPKERRVFSGFLRTYERVLRGALKVKWLVVLVSFALFFTTLWLIRQRGMEMFPNMDSPQLTVSASMPEGSLFEDTVDMAERLQERLLRFSDIETLGVTIGNDSMMSMMGSMFGMSSQGGSEEGGTEISIYLILDDKRSMTNEELAQAIREQTTDLDCEITVDTGNMDMTTMMGNGVSISVKGNDLDTLRELGLQVTDIVTQTEGVVDVSGVSHNIAPEWRVRVDKDKAMEQGLTVAQVLGVVAERLQMPESSLGMTLDGKDYTLLIQDGDWTEPDYDSLAKLSLSGANGSEIKLSDIAEIYEGETLDSINRSNQTRTLTVSGEIAEGYNVTLCNDKIAEKLEEMTIPEGYSVTLGGQDESIRDSFEDLYLMLAVALAFIYLIMVAEFQSLLSPFIVMFTIPLAFTGAFVALLIVNMPLSVVAMVGMILLSGVVVNNGIVLIDYTNQLRRAGKTRVDAVVEACSTRLRPILMTALTTIVAMSTMTIGVGMGTEMVQPMAVASVGGMLYATLMTLFVVPSIYMIFHRKEKPLANRDDVEGDELVPLPEEELPEDAGDAEMGTDTDL